MAWPAHDNCLFEDQKKCTKRTLSMKRTQPSCCGSQSWWTSWRRCDGSANTSTIFDEDSETITQSDENRKSHRQFKIFAPSFKACSPTCHTVWSAKWRSFRYFEYLQNKHQWLQKIPINEEHGLQHWDSTATYVAPTPAANQISICRLPRAVFRLIRILSLEGSASAIDSV